MSYIDDNYIFNDDTFSATVRLPSAGAEGYDAVYGYFHNFVVFYRIYLSDTLLTGKIDPATQFRSISGSMESNFNSLANLTNKISTSVETGNLENTFIVKYNFFKLALVNENGLPLDIDNILSRGALGETIKFSFPEQNGSIPRLELKGNEYYLQRATGGLNISFKPQPENRYFQSDDDLLDITNATMEINADIEKPSPSNKSSIYSYVLFYIAAQGESREIPPKTIYSQPSFVGILMLPRT